MGLYAFFFFFHYPPQSTREGFFLFYSKAHKRHINLGLPADLQKFMLVSQSILPVVAAAKTVHLEWCQSDKPLLDPTPLGACAFCSSGKC